MQRPTKPCYCGANDWWLTPEGRYLCGKCHPNPNPGSSPELPATGEKYSSEVLALRARVILGNKKLNDAWEQIKGIVHDSEEWNYQMEQWHQANERLSLLCTKLQARGYTDCLYLDEQGKKTVKCLVQGGIGCRVCPSGIRYWEKEFSEL
ncbi:unnamed protein product [marine sediment metagenome]|uniref:Uncharacterized protein n=1 Tax=marine sediment metagenome TaxID=412755 RepID=X1PVW1_9ZZZZ